MDVIILRWWLAMLINVVEMLTNVVPMFTSVAIMFVAMFTNVAPL